MLSSSRSQWITIALQLLLFGVTYAEIFKPICASPPTPDVPGSQVLSTRSRSLIVSNVTVCEVNVTLTHPGEEDKVLVQVWLPQTGWNGRFQATGGGGYATGQNRTYLEPAVIRGYAAAQTDGGHVEDSLSPASWALNDRGQVDLTLLLNFASRSLHDMAVVGKAVTRSFYGTAPRYSYWNGCSTGGRQGYMAAQRHPEDFDGILANAPAINWARFIPAEQWGQVVMNREDTFPTSCVFDTFGNASIAACDGLDGVVDGIISDPNACTFDPYTLVGTVVTCDGVQTTITQKMAQVVQKIHQGPRTVDGRFLWYGLNYGTPYSGLDGTAVVNGTSVGAPFEISDTWIRYFIERNPQYDTSKMSYAEYESIFHKSIAMYESLIGTDDLDLSAFRERGGKLLTWHGLADQLIFPNGTIHYRQQVEEVMGSRSTVDEFYRLFLAPGVEHCGGGVGPVPVDPLSALVDWVEDDQAPRTILALSTKDNGTIVSRNLCPYPLVSKYDGHGDPDQAESYACTSGY
ncbi:Tannase/feruloyl esterase [Aspergillus floccosus]